MKNRTKIAHIGKQCVACGCCVRKCPRQALEIKDGVIVKVDEKLCVGCGICEKICPAGIIEIKVRG